MPTSCSSSTARARACVLGHLEVDEQGLHHLLADREDRVERGHRLLEDHRDVAAADLAHLLGREREQVAPVEGDAALRHPPGLGEQAHDRERGDRLAAAGLADDRDDFAPIDRIGNALDRADSAARGLEPHMQVAHLEQRRRRGGRRSLIRQRYHPSESGDFPRLLVPPAARLYLIAGPAANGKTGSGPRHRIADSGDLTSRKCGIAKAGARECAAPSRTVK